MSTTSRSRNRTNVDYTKIFLLGLLAVLTSAAAHAQQGSTAIVVGLVDDQSERAIPGAVVTLTHGTPIRHRGGHRRARPVPHAAAADRPLRGRRSSSPASSGSSSERRAEHRRRAHGQRHARAGRDSEEVTVAAAPPLISLADSTVGTVITNQQIKDLPLNGRDYLQLAALSSGTGVGGGIRHQRRRPERRAGGVPARWPGQQQPADCGARPEGSDQAVDRCHPGIQGRHQRLLRGVRPVVGGRRQRRAQVGHQQLTGAVYEFFRDERSMRRTTSPRRSSRSGATSSAARRLPDPAEQDVLLRRRRDRHDPQTATR